jgi:cytochrome c-type biogenesis protein CcmH/NrfG
VEPAHIPDNLPLLPFESSPHVWSFSKYKDTFHGEVMPHSVEELSQKKPTGQAPSHEGDEISLEKTPMTKSDESLVFLAGVMLLVIILILGYMYSNGRL